MSTISQAARKIASSPCSCQNSMSNFRSGKPCRTTRVFQFRWTVLIFSPPFRAARAHSPEQSVTVPEMTHSDQTCSGHFAAQLIWTRPQADEWPYWSRAPGFSNIIAHCSTGISSFLICQMRGWRARCANAPESPALWALSAKAYKSIESTTHNTLARE